MRCFSKRDSCALLCRRQYGIRLNIANDVGLLLSYYPTNSTTTSQNLQPPASREFESDGWGFYYAVDLIVFQWPPTRNNLWFRVHKNNLLGWMPLNNQLSSSHTSSDHNINTPLLVGHLAHLFYSSVWSRADGNWTTLIMTNCWFTF